MGLAAWVLTSLKLTGTAIAITRRNVERYPHSAAAHAHLGDGLLAMADTAAAIEQFEKAVELATPTHHPVLARTTRILEELAAAKRGGRPKPR